MLVQAESAEEPHLHVLEIAGNALIGGMEKYVFNLAKGLPGRQFKVSCIAPYESAFTASLRDLGCEVYVTAMDDNPPWRSIQFITELIRHQGIDLIHAHLPKAHVLAGLVGRLTDTPVVATIHGMDISSQELGISRTTGSHLTVVCQDAYSQALALGIPAERLTLIPNGVDLKAFAPHRSGANFRKALKIPANVPLVGFVGRLTWEKGPDQFIAMANHIHKRQPEVQFVLVGEGLMEADLHSMIQSSGLGEHVHLAGLWMNTWEVFPAFDIVAQTSRVEGMPFAMLEAMACGKPVIAMAVGGVAEVIEVATTGLLSAPGDWAGLGDASLRLLSNPERLKQMGQAARKRVEESFDLEVCIHRLANLFHRQVSCKDSGQTALSANLLGPASSTRSGTLPVEPASAYHPRR